MLAICYTLLENCWQKMGRERDGMRERRGREREERGEVIGERKARGERERRKVGEKGEGGSSSLLLGGYTLATAIPP